ncbi:hypothetical protein WDU94_002558 [Cyamophila willieti]
MAMSRPASHPPPEHKQQLLLHDHCAAVAAGTDWTSTDDLNAGAASNRVSFTSSDDDFEYRCGASKAATSNRSSQYAHVRPGFHLSQGVGHLLSMWPRSLYSLLWTVGLVVAACFVIVLTILILVLSTNFSLDSDFVLHHKTQSRSIRPADLVNDVINFNNGDVIDAENGGFINAAENGGFLNAENEVINSGLDVNKLVYYGVGNSDRENGGVRNDVMNTAELARGLTTSMIDEPNEEDPKDKRRTFRYILNGSDDRINLFYVIDASKTQRLSAHALNVLRYYVRAGYNVYLVRVCQTPVTAQADSVRREKPLADSMSFFEQWQHGKVRSERVADADNRPYGNDEKQGPVEENLLGTDRESIDEIQNDPMVKLAHDKGDLARKVVNGIDSVSEIESTTVDVETYDMTVKKELSLAALRGESAQSREFFSRISQLIGRNRTYAEDSLQASKSRRPVTSEEIEVTQSEDELKKVALCSCPQCRAYSEGNTRSKTIALAELKRKLGMTSPRGPVQRRGKAAAAFQDDWSKVEILNVNYDELLTDSGIFANLSRRRSIVSGGASSEDLPQDHQLKENPRVEFISRGKPGADDDKTDVKLSTDVLLLKAAYFGEDSTNVENRGNASSRVQQSQRDLSRMSTERNSEIHRTLEKEEEDLRRMDQSLFQRKNGTSQVLAQEDDAPDMNLVKLILLWKFGNSMVLLRDQSLLLHSRMVVNSRVNLGFQVIYTPYECSSVIYNLMDVYRKDRNMNKAIVEVYRLFCKSMGRFCNAITYVQLKRSPMRK